MSETNNQIAFLLFEELQVFPSHSDGIFHINFRLISKSIEIILINQAHHPYLQSIFSENVVVFILSKIFVLQLSTAINGRLQIQIRQNPLNLKLGLQVDEMIDSEIQIMVARYGIFNA